ncbi:UNKNOWN [Stylonychia lemnae]|uniref:Uncharacterized protein n=1 Tax=Stylonychia lemnae TaxID=5949 RepID=A0A078A456_STYLE|nr:UNKNOWN [Stylonychia lemnae]|eukprot:CDW76669.1 UNKNOWN [Stylonychia lemnae]
MGNQFDSCCQNFNSKEAIEVRQKIVSPSDQINLPRISKSKLRKGCQTPASCSHKSLDQENLKQMINKHQLGESFHLNCSMHSRKKFIEDSIAYREQTSVHFRNNLDLSSNSSDESIKQITGIENKKRKQIQFLELKEGSRTSKSNKRQINKIFGQRTQRLDSKSIAQYSPKQRNELWDYSQYRRATTKSSENEKVLQKLKK